MTDETTDTVGITRRGDDFIVELDQCRIELLTPALKDGVIRGTLSVTDPEGVNVHLARLNLDNEAARAKVKPVLAAKGVNLNGIDAMLRSLGLAVRQHERESSHGRAKPAEPVTDGPPQHDSLAGSLDAAVGLLLDYMAFARREQADACALWAAHTFGIDKFEQSPILAINSPQPQSGKSRLLDVLEQIVAEPWRVISPSEAVLFRKIAADQPTLMLDEVDAVFGPLAPAHEGVRAVLNAGNRKGTTVPRVSGESMELQDFEIYCPKALAGLGRLPTTIADRSIPIRLRRRRRDEPVRKFRNREARALGAPIRQSLAHYVSTLTFDEYPELPDVLSDRAADGWEPLVQIADAAGGDWPERARRAAKVLSADAQVDDSESEAIALLTDIRRVFNEKNVDRIESALLLDALLKRDEAPWNEINRGRPLSPNSLASRLRPFGIRPKVLRFSVNSVARGFERKAFEDAWDRYLGEPEAEDDEDENEVPEPPSTDRNSRNTVTSPLQQAPQNGESNGVTVQTPSERGVPPPVSEPAATNSNASGGHDKDTSETVPCSWCEQPFPPAQLDPGGLCPTCSPASVRDDG